MQTTVLIVDDNVANRDLLRQTVEPMDCEVLYALNGEMALRVSVKSQPDVILLDFLMPGMDGFETCRRLKADATTREIPVIFITAEHDLPRLLEGFEVGGVDYITKPFRPAEVRARVETHLKLSRLNRALAEKNVELSTTNAALVAEKQLRKKAEVSLAEADSCLSLLTEQEAARWGICGLAGISPGVAQIVTDIRKLQPVKTAVLITGESGTGKELVARALHHGGSRVRGPFIAINCAAIGRDMAESELFGHVKGAFTGAVADRKGAFELANRGTLFLDEVGDMPALLQAKLLRTLEDGTIWPLGAGRERTVDVRVIAATNVDLQQRMSAGEFRQDLFYRLAHYTVALPPLRERQEDIPLLATHFAQRFAIEMGRPAPDFSPEALARLALHVWPGNVRELRNAVERAMIESTEGRIEPRHLVLGPAGAFCRNGNSFKTDAVQPAEEAANLPLNVKRAMRELVRRAVVQSEGNVSRSADLLGVSRQWVYRVLAEDPGAEGGAEKR